MGSRALASRRASKITHVGALRLDAGTRTININSAKLPRPDRVYDADVAWIEHCSWDVRLFFGKHERPVGSQFRSRVEIRYPVEVFHGHFWSYSRDLHEGLRRHINSLPSPPKPEVPRSQLPSLGSVKDHSEWANFDLISHTGTEACIDFFHLPTHALARFVRQGTIANLEIDPVVRVQLAAGALLDLLDHCASIMDSVMRQLPPEVARGKE